ncbi:phosphohistidine phosphatase SixA [bacterium]|nr:MAG: phosphohistidine phosphatase SixA [bacterium]
MNLYLVQHARAKSKEENPDRPLTEQGYIDAEKVAKFVGKSNTIILDVIYHSGKTRAGQTAEIFAKYLAPTDGVKESDGLKALDNPEIWANRVKEMERDIMLVGHLPYMSKLASLLISGNQENKVVEFQKGGIVCLSGDDNGNWSLRWMIIPELL